MLLRFFVAKTIGSEPIVSDVSLCVYTQWSVQFADWDFAVVESSCPSSSVEVYPRPDGTIYLCGIGGSDYISKEQLKEGAFREVCEAKPDRVDAARQSFQEMSSIYKEKGELDRVQACMRPCPPDAKPYMGRVPGYEGAYINAGHNCW